MALPVDVCSNIVCNVSSENFPESHSF